MARKEIAKVKGRDAIRQKRWDMVLDPHSERCWLLPFRVGPGGKNCRSVGLSAREWFC